MKKRTKGLSEASARMKRKGTVGLFTRKAGGKKNIGKKIASTLKPGSNASTKTKREANFAKMARRGWKPLGKRKKRRG